MKDFTLQTYRCLLLALQADGYRFLTFEQYCLNKDALHDQRFIILRHDVDLKAENSLQTAQIEHELGIRASYYFRIIPSSNQPDIIRAIAAMGHEIGYHYEDVSLVHGDLHLAEEHFAAYLNYFRTYYPVRTVCMHGVVRSTDSRKLWDICDYHTYGIVGEPYYDTDFSQVFYLTDTGREWDGYKVSMYDKIPEYQAQWSREGKVYHSTFDILKAVAAHTLPPRIMMTTHPQRWTDQRAAWCKEYVLQRGKNLIKRLLIAIR